jgi:hypothetical protein
MKKEIVGALCSSLLVLAAAPSQAITISLDPSAQNVAAGSIVDVALVVSDLGDGVAPSLSTFDVDIAFDGGVLSFLDATFGDPVLGDQLDLFGLGSIFGTTPGAGTVNLFELSLDLPSDLDDLQAPGFILAILTLSALGAGDSPLDLTVNVLGDANGEPLEAAVSGGSVTVTEAAPEPASLALLVSGFAGLACTRARRRPGA